MTLIFPKYKFRTVSFCHVPVLEKACMLKVANDGR